MFFKKTLLIAVMSALCCFVPLSGQESADVFVSTEAGEDAETGETAAESKTAAGAAQETPDAESPLQQAEKITENIEETVSYDAQGLSFAERFGIALAIIAVQILLILVIWQLFKFFAKKAVEKASGKIKPLTFKKYKLLNTKQIIEIILFFLRIFKYIITVFQFFITVPIVFSLFPATKDLASVLFGYILAPFRNIALGAIHYIPNIITIVIIIFITRYMIRGLRFFSVQISRGKLVIPGFYADWAEPTFNILRFLLWAFTVAIVYPYLPLSDSRIFQGVSVFVGIIFSLGSSSAIGNLVAGLVITYMRPFKIGDRIQIKDITGFVMEKTPMVVRIKTHKNEYVTFPNLIILSSSIINYNTSSDEDEEGLILYASITFGYGTPWQTVHRILIDAALTTDHVLKNPKPFVLQTALDDFYCQYQINFYVKEVDRVPAIYSGLFENIQEGFHAEGLDMTAAHYRINLPPHVQEQDKPAETTGQAKKTARGKSAR
ncbi:MAG: mechanosensitive ion channel family protein [Treponema sp.]|jgi:small-conductance mechanosensitive channel|nr:mechanosensitive ion channel family protein [Treponema sp.]